MAINRLIIELENYGLTAVLLPFILIFTLIYAVLSKINLFEKNYNFVISGVMALTTVMLHVLDRYPPCWDVVVIINNAVPKISLLIIVIIFFLLVVGVVGVNLSFFNKFMSWIAIVIFIFFIYIFLTSRGEGCPTYNFDFLFIPYLEFILPLLAFILIIWFITKDSDSSEDYDLY